MALACLITPYGSIERSSENRLNAAIPLFFFLGCGLALAALIPRLSVVSFANRFPN